MSRSNKGKSIVVILAFAVLLMTGLACGPAAEIATGMAGPATPAPAPTPTQREIRIEGARSRGATIFEYNGTAEGMGICYGTEQILSFDGRGVKEFCLTSEEANNLSLCQRNDAGNYDAHQDISGVEPGDWLVWSVAASSAESTPTSETDQGDVEVEFGLSGTPIGDTALFVDETLIVGLTVGYKVHVPLVGNEKCGVNLKVRNAEGNWEHVTSLGCVEQYASIDFTMSGLEVEVSRGSWK